MPTFYQRPTISSDEVNAIAIRNTEIWAATNAGLARWSGTVWTIYSVSSQSLPSDTVTSLVMDKNGNLWIGTRRGIVRYDGIRFADMSLGLPDRFITSVTADTSGKPWVGTYSGGVAQYQGTSWSVYGAPNQLPSNFINAVAVDSANRTWIGMQQNGLVRYENFTWFAAFDMDNSQIPDNNVTVIMPSIDGTLWVGTRSGGLARLLGSNWTQFRTANSGFTEDNIMSVAVTATGEIWTCGPGDVSHFDGINWTTYSSRSLGLLQGGFTALALDNQNRPWVGTFEQGVLRFNGSSWIQYNTSNTTGFPDNFINAITVAPNGDVWIATYNGVGRFNGTNWITYNTISLPAIPNNLVRTIGVGVNGTVWIADGQSMGPIRFDLTSWTVVDATPIGITPGSIQAIWVSEIGDPWIGTATSGIAHYVGSWQYHSTTQNSNLPSNDVRSIQGDLYGNLWIGTSNGLARLIRPTTLTDVYKNTDSGMPTNSVRFVAVGSDNRIYAATDSGLAVYSGFQKTSGSNLTVRNRMFGYGTITAGQSSMLSTWVINNTVISVRIDSIRFTQNVAGGFTLISQPPPFVIPSNDSVQVSIRFSPTQVLFYGGNVQIYSAGSTRADTLYIGGSATAQQIPASFYLHPEQYGMISIPGVLQNKDIQSVFSSLGPYNSKTWRIFYWKNNRYLELPEFSTADSLFFKPGIAFWLITRDTVEVMLQSVSATPAVEYLGVFASVANYPVILNPGWNMIGNPFAYPVQWSQIVNSNLVQNPVVWNGVGYYYNQTVLYPWEGYFVYNPSSSPVTLRIPPFSSVPKPEGRTLSKKEFVLNLQVHGVYSNLNDDQNAVGMLESAQDGFDREDYLEAPPIGDYLQLSIMEGNNRFAGDFRAVSSSGAFWDLSLSTTGKKEIVNIAIDGASVLNESFQIWLLDQDRGCLIPIRNWKGEMEVEERGKLHHLRLIVGTEEYAMQKNGSIPLIPYCFVLFPNFPNPFNPETKIGYQLGEKSHVQLEIFDLLGRRIKIWIEEGQPAGMHQVVWNGKDDTGIAVKSGLYVFRISTGKFTASRKMLLIR